MICIAIPAEVMQEPNHKEIVTRARSLRPLTYEQKVNSLRSMSGRGLTKTQNQ